MLREIALLFCLVVMCASWEQIGFRRGRRSEYVTLSVEDVVVWLCVLVALLILVLAVGALVFLIQTG